MERHLEGMKVLIGGREFLVPPMLIGTFKRTRADRKLIGDERTDPEDRVEAAVRVVHASLQRNYPDLTIEEIEDLIALPDLRRLLPQIVEAWSADEDAPAGKAPAGSP